MNKLRIVCDVPANEVERYTSIGFTRQPSIRPERSLVSVEKTVNSNLTERVTHCAFSPPYLIQRGTIRRPLGAHTESRLTQAVDMDYMGAAEFEWGALPLSLRRMEALFPLFRIWKSDTITAERDYRTFHLRIWGNLSTDQLNQYEQWLVDAILRKIHLKEDLRMFRFSEQEKLPVPLPVSAKDELSVIDFWWDVRNDVIFSFDKNFMSRLPGHLQQSWDYMNLSIGEAA